MTIPAFISSQLPERRELLHNIHSIIMQEDKTVRATIKPMMGKEMIIYDAPGTFKYGLSSVKNYISLHLMPIYCVKTLHAKYKKLLKEADFQKGCINFTSAEEVPLEILRSLISECSKIDLLAIRENYTRQKKNKS